MHYTLKHMSVLHPTVIYYGVFIQQQEMPASLYKRTWTDVHRMELTLQLHGTCLSILWLLIHCPLRCNEVECVTYLGSL